MKETVCRITGKTLQGPMQFCTECGKPELLGANYCSNCGMPMSHPAVCSCKLCLHKTEQVGIKDTAADQPRADPVLEEFHQRFDSNAASISPLPPQPMSAPERNPQEISSMGPLKILTDHFLKNSEMWFIPLNDGSRLEVIPRADPRGKCWDYGLWFNRNGSIFELGRWGTGLNGNKGFRPIKTSWGSLRGFLVRILADGFIKDPSKCFPPGTEGSVPATNGADLIFKRSIKDDHDSFGLYLRRTENNVPVTRLVISWVFDQGGNLLRIEGPE